MSLPADLHGWLKRRAEEEGQPMAEIARKAIERERDRLGSGQMELWAQGLPRETEVPR